MTEGNPITKTRAETTKKTAADMTAEATVSKTAEMTEVGNTMGLRPHAEKVYRIVTAVALIPAHVCLIAEAVESVVFQARAVFKATA